MKIIAVDFDGCLCESKWPAIGKPRWAVIHGILREQAEGAKVILWTCREGRQLQEAVLWCLNHGLAFDAVNDNLPDNIAFFGNNSRKIYANEYWDDKNILITGAGTVTSIVRANPNGGLSAKIWDNDGKLLVKNIGEKRKRWWQRWRSE